MDYIEVKLLSGNTLSVRRDLILTVMKLEYVSKQLLKEKPFLKEVGPCSILLLSTPSQEVYCQDSYESIIEKLNG